MPRRLMSLVASSLSLLFAGCERSLIYHPTNASESRLEALASEFGLVPWLDPDGERIGWSTQKNSTEGPRHAVVVFHGNGGHAAMRAYYAPGFRAAEGGARRDLFLFEYPGFGSRPGTPSEERIKTAARAAVEHLLAQDYASLTLVGESLGSGVATHLAANIPEAIGGLLLVTPFTNLKDVARHHYPGLLVNALLSERYDNLEALSRYRGPVAILIAERDEIVPAALGRQLYRAYEGPKKLWVQAGRRHNTLSFDPGEPWWNEVTRFLASHR